MEDGEIDDYIAQMLAKRAKEQKEKYDLFGNSVYVGDSKIPNTNKRFLLNTIKNTSSYNESLRKREKILDLGKKKKAREERNEVRAEKRKVLTEPLKSIEFDESSPASAFSCRLKAMVQHSKLSSKTKRSKLPPGKTIIEAVLGSHIKDTGIYGPQKYSTKDGQLERNIPNNNLPEKCPW
jgi:hypothetical protein